MQIQNKRDFWAGIMFLAIGLTFGVLAQQYRLGSAAKMGPGWFPTALGVLLAAAGAIIMLRALGSSSAKTQIEAFRWRELIFVLGSVSFFALSLPYLGVIVSVAALILIAACADKEFQPIEALGLTVGLLFMTYFVFVRGLAIQFPVWPTIFEH